MCSIAVPLVGPCPAALCFDGAYERILSGGLDRQVKVYDVRDYSVVHSFKNPSPVLAIGLSVRPCRLHMALDTRQPNGSHLVVGTTDGELSVSHRRITDALPAACAPACDTPLVLTPHSHPQQHAPPRRHLVPLLCQGPDGAAGPGLLPRRPALPSTALQSDVVVGGHGKRRTAKWDLLLRRFRYAEALDSVLLHAVRCACVCGAG